MIFNSGVTPLVLRLTTRATSMCSVFPVSFASRMVSWFRLLDRTLQGAAATVGRLRARCLVQLSLMMKIASIPLVSQSTALATCLLLTLATSGFASST